MLGTILGAKDAMMSKKDEAGVLIRGNSQSTTIVGLLCLQVLHLQVQPPVEQKYYKEKIPECSQK